jgi:hypothetical protein
MFLLISPLVIIKSNGKSWSINLNHYRNTYYRTLNNLKISYKEEMTLQIKKLPLLTKIKIIYTLYPATRRLCDVANVCSITDKFFCDSLVELEIIKDDNYLYIPEVNYVFGNVDKLNPRVEILIIQI